MPVSPARSSPTPEPSTGPAAYPARVIGTIRALGPDDAEAVVAVFHSSRTAAMPWLRVVHTPDEDHAFFARELADSASCGAEVDGRVVGFAIHRDGWLRHLYVDPAHQGLGVGSALLARVVAEEAPAVQLWAFARNVRALDFYRRHGFVVVEETDGQGNEEREPDVRLSNAEMAGHALQGD